MLQHLDFSISPFRLLSRGVNLSLSHLFLFLFPPLVFLVAPARLSASRVSSTCSSVVAAPADDGHQDMKAAARQRQSGAGPTLASGRAVPGWTCLPALLFLAAWSSRCTTGDAVVLLLCCASVSPGAASHLRSSSFTCRRQLGVR